MGFREKFGTPWFYRVGLRFAKLFCILLLVLPNIVNKMKIEIGLSFQENIGIGFEGGRDVEGVPFSVLLLLQIAS